MSDQNQQSTGGSARSFADAEVLCLNAAVNLMQLRASTLLLQAQRNRRRVEAEKERLEEVARQKEAEVKAVTTRAGWEREVRRHVWRAFLRSILVR